MYTLRRRRLVGRLGRKLLLDLGGLCESAPQPRRRRAFFIRRIKLRSSVPQRSRSRTRRTGIYASQRAHASAGDVLLVRMPLVLASCGGERC